MILLQVLNDNNKHGILNKLPKFEKFDLVLFCVKHVKISIKMHMDHFLII